MEPKMLPTSNKPGCYIIIKSSWKDHYHVIYENPEDRDGHHAHYFLSKEEMRVKLPIILEGKIEMEPKIRIPYGKFKGKEMHEIPSGYLRWVAENLGETLACAADEEWRWREKNRQHWEE